MSLTSTTPSAKPRPTTPESRVADMDKENVAAEIVYGCITINEIIGETAILGDDVKLYQGVTLGAKSFETDDQGNPVKGVKRHPDLGDNVTVYPGANILVPKKSDYEAANRATLMSRIATGDWDALDQMQVHLRFDASMRGQCSSRPPCKVVRSVTD